MTSLEPPRPANSLPLGDNLLAALRSQGFTPAAVRHFAERPDLIRLVLAKTAARLESSAKLEPLHDPLEWKVFVEERNFGGGRRCDVAGGSGYWEDPAFSQAAARPSSQLFLLETDNGHRSRAELEASARQLAPDCLQCTPPRAIFEVLNLMWTRLAEIKAAYIMVASTAIPDGTPLPIIFNPPHGNIRLGFVNQVPRNAGYTGYVAYCGG